MLNATKSFSPLSDEESVQAPFGETIDLVKMLICHGFECPGRRKSDFWLKKVSFW